MGELTLRNSAPSTSSPDSPGTETATPNWVHTGQQSLRPSEETLRDVLIFPSTQVAGDGAQGGARAVPGCQGPV